MFHTPERSRDKTRWARWSVARSRAEGSLRAALPVGDEGELQAGHRKGGVARLIVRHEDEAPVAVVRTHRGAGALALLRLDRRGRASEFRVERDEELLVAIDPDQIGDAHRLGGGLDARRLGAVVDVDERAEERPRPRRGGARGRGEREQGRKEEQQASHEGSPFRHFTVYPFPSMQAAKARLYCPRAAA